MHPARNINDSKVISHHNMLDSFTVMALL